MLTIGGGDEDVDVILVTSIREFLGMRNPEDSNSARLNRSEICDRPLLEGWMSSASIGRCGRYVDHRVGLYGDQVCHLGSVTSSLSERELHDSLQIADFPIHTLRPMPGGERHGRFARVSVDIPPFRKREAMAGYTTWASSLYDDLPALTHLLQAMPYSSLKQRKAILTFSRVQPSTLSQGSKFYMEYSRELKDHITYKVVMKDFLTGRTLFSILYPCPHMSA